jgi:hypothetical protein
MATGKTRERMPLALNGNSPGLLCLAREPLTQTMSRQMKWGCARADAFNFSLRRLRLGVKRRPKPSGMFGECWIKAVVCGD